MSFIKERSKHWSTKALRKQLAQVVYYIFDGEVHQGRKWGKQIYDSREEAERACEDEFVSHQGPTKTRVYPRGGAGQPYWRYTDNAKKLSESHKKYEKLLREMRRDKKPHDEIMTALRDFQP